MSKAYVEEPSADRHAAPRADYGKPIDGFIERQPPHLRAILAELRGLIESTVPKAAAALKWGMPCYTLEGKMLCMLGAHRSHVNLVLVGPPEGFSDPEQRLAGSGKGGRHLRLESLDELPRAWVRRWLRAAASYALAKVASA
jgi:hypothetical protein